MHFMKNRIFKLLSVAVAGLLLAGCYNDFDNPQPAKIHTDADFEAAGMTYISIGDLKQRFVNEKGKPGRDAASITIDEPLFTRGKVISSDRDGNVYKSLFIYDAGSESAIELRLATGNYIFHPVGQVVYVKLQGLVVGNYGGMLSIGMTSADPKYSNANLTDVLIRRHIFSGEQQAMLETDTLKVTRDNYKDVLTDKALGRLVRFERITSCFGKSNWGYQNTFPNYFANSNSYDNTSPGWEDIDQWATWATKRSMSTSSATEVYFYGSAWFSYDRTSEDLAGNYVVRSSGYSSFRDKMIPRDGEEVTITALYGIYISGRSAYQLTLNSDRDVVRH